MSRPTSLVLLGLLTARTAVGQPCPCDADANQNGVVNNQDILFIIQCAQQPPPPMGACVQADVNCDCVVNDADVNAAQCILFGQPPPVCCPAPAMNCGQPLANDNCENAIVIGNGSTPFDTTGATTDGVPHPDQCNFFNDPQISHDIWFHYTATASGAVQVSLCGSSYDTELAMYEGCETVDCPPGDAQLAACNDDSCGLQSEVTFAAALDNCYVIRVGGFQNNTGPGTLTIAPPPPPDNWSTWTDGTPDLTYQDIAIPAGFFGPGSEPFEGRIQYAGAPLDSTLYGDADTRVQRSADPVGPGDPPGAAGTVPIQVVALSLASSGPITVMIAGQPTHWDVTVGLSQVPAPAGSLTAVKTHDNGGTFDSILFVQPLLVFQRVGADCLCGDLDGSGNAVSLNDHRLFARCFGRTQAGGGCGLEAFACADLDQAGGPDLRDFRVFQNTFGSVSVHAPPFCSGEGSAVPPVVVLDSGQMGMPPLQFQSAGVPFVHVVSPALEVIVDPEARFVPGIDEPTPGDPESQVVHVVVEDSPQVRHTVCVPVPKKLCGPGDDYFATAPCDSGAMTMATFVDNPIPAGFFDPGSEPFDGLVTLVGVPLDPVNLGDADTRITRLDPLCFPTLPSVSVSPIVVSELSLASAAPISVMVSGMPQTWDVQVGLSGMPPAEMGQIIVRKLHRNGGTFEANFFVQPKFTFTKTSDPSEVRVLDTGLAGLPATELGTSNPFAPPTGCDGEWPWVQSLIPGPPPAGSACFIPGVREDPMMPMMQTCEMQCHVQEQCFGVLCGMTHCNFPPNYLINCVP